MRSDLPEEAHETIDRLHEFYERRRQYDEQKSYQWILHVWLWVHLPLSIVLILWTATHAVLALLYW